MTTLKRMTQCAVGAAFLGLTQWSLTAVADESFKPEVFTVEEAIPKGPNVFVNEAGWDAASKIHVYGQDGLTYKGLLSLGLTSQILLSKDASKVYAFSDYMKRYSYGPVESVLQIFDVNTLTPETEIVIPNQAAKAIGMSQLLEKSADESLIYIQNATPATSVTIANQKIGVVQGIIPTPGCYGIIPSTRGYRFSTWCGTGQFKTFTVNGDQYSVETSDPLFDSENSPLYVHSQRLKDGKLLLVGFNGDLVIADDSGPTMRFLETIPVASKEEGNWVPGGYMVTAYNAPNDLVYMIMHSDAYEGSHKDGSEEIWAYSLKKRKLLSRSPAEHLVAITVTQDKTPKVYGSNEDEESVDEYTVASTKDFSLTKAASDGKAGWTTSLLVAK
jgi:methylamine dehydrogenase heavy chain